MEWKIYLSGEIHTDWRERIIHGCHEYNLKINFSSAVTPCNKQNSEKTVNGIKVHYIKGVGNALIRYWRFAHSASKRIEELNSKKEAVEHKLKELANASGEAWRELKSGVEKAVDDLKVSLEKASSKF